MVFRQCKTICNTICRRTTTTTTTIIMILLLLYTAAVIKEKINRQHSQRTSFRQHTSSSSSSTTTQTRMKSHCNRHQSHHPHPTAPLLDEPAHGSLDPPEMHDRCCTPDNRCCSAVCDFVVVPCQDQNTTAVVQNLVVVVVVVAWWCIPAIIFHENVSFSDCFPKVPTKHAMKQPHAK